MRHLKSRNTHFLSQTKKSPCGCPGHVPELCPSTEVSGPLDTLFNASIG